MVAKGDGASERRLPKTQPTRSQKCKRQRRNGQSCPSRRMVQTDAERDGSFNKDQLILFILVMSSSKIRTRKMTTGFRNTKTGLTSVGTDSGKGGSGRSLNKMN